MKRLLTLTLIAITLFGIFSCTHKKEEAKTEFGVIIPLTGSLGFIGEAERNGIFLLPDSIKNNVQFNIQDSKSKASEGVTIANKFVLDENISIIFSSTTGLSRSVLPVITKADRIHFALCMDPTIHKESNKVVRFYYSFKQEAKSIANYLKKAKKQDVGILYLNHSGIVQEVDDFLKPALDELGINFLIEESYDFGQLDFKNVVSKIKNSGTKTLIILGYGNLYSQIFNAIHGMNFKKDLDIVGGWGLIAPNNLTNEDLENVKVACPAYIIHGSTETRFAKEYMKKIGKKPNFDAVFMYDAINFVIKELEKNNYDYSKFLHSINTQDIKYQGELGRYNLNKGGDLQIEMEVGVYKNGKLEELSF